MWLYLDSLKIKKITHIFITDQ